uniref:Uncharacterized protein n=1 Tax=Tanacetum cinerariifolium TaxID=118510 RepID=A0A699J0H2_TANCI|nr:hypothetical protein [Tanacetum cinerariifolium]GFA01774.1 hypothetical protein [Tanacetum cinerariifolium]
MFIESWDRSSFARAMIELIDNVELKDTIVISVLKLNPRQAARRVHVGLKLGFIRTKQVYQLVSNKNVANTSGKRNLLKKVDSPTKPDSDGEVEEVFNETASFMASTSLNSGGGSEYGIKSLLEQLRKTTVDHDYDAYDDDMYEGYDISENI